MIKSKVLIIFAIFFMSLQPSYAMKIEENKGEKTCQSLDYCFLCKIKFNKNSIIKELPCGGQFHCVCLHSFALKILKSNKIVCPMCKLKVQGGYSNTRLQVLKNEPQIISPHCTLCYKTPFFKKFDNEYSFTKKLLCGDRFHLGCLVTCLTDTNNICPWCGLQDAYKPHLCKTLFIAYNEGHLHCCEKHLERGADVNEHFSDDNTLMHLAATSPFSDDIKIFLKYKANINEKNFTGKTPLIIAVKHKNKKIVKLLLENKADPNINDEYQKCPLSIAYKKSNHKITDLLLKYGAKVPDFDEKKEWQNFEQNMNIPIDIKIALKTTSQIEHLSSNNQVFKFLNQAHKLINEDELLESSFKRLTLNDIEELRNKLTNWHTTWNKQEISFSEKIKHLPLSPKKFVEAEKTFEEQTYKFELWEKQKNLLLGMQFLSEHDLHQLKIQVNFAFEQLPYKIWTKKEKLKNNK